MHVYIYGLTEEEGRFLEQSKFEEDLQDIFTFEAKNYIADRPEEFAAFLRKEEEDKLEDEWLQAWYRRSV